MRRTVELHAAIGEGLSQDDQLSIYGVLFIKMGLNTGAEEDYKLIPSTMSPRKLVHEFEEYRPYVVLAQFQREMGKYVDDAEVARLSGYVFVPVDLNTASDEDILSIPGVGSRMEHEFKEYRPYQNMAQFRREIGKYVDDKEVARLERYVTIK